MKETEQSKIKSWKKKSAVYQLEELVSALLIASSPQVPAHEVGRYKTLIELAKKAHLASHEICAGFTHFMDYPLSDPMHWNTMDWQLRWDRESWYGNTELLFTASGRKQIPAAIKRINNALAKALSRRL
jgi:hypothetical protein